MEQQSIGQVPDLPESARRTAAELVRLVDEATRDLPFGAEPASLGAALAAGAGDAEGQE